jgi:hypothetical protein
VRLLTGECGDSAVLVVVQQLVIHKGQVLTDLHKKPGQLRDILGPRDVPAPCNYDI